MLNGEKKWFSLKEVITQANKISQLAHDSPSPYDEFSLFKLIQLFAIDIFRPGADGKDMKDAIANLWQSGEFNEALVDDYFDKAREKGISFDLFDNERPFMQSFPSDFGAKPNIIPVSVLEPTWLTGNNPAFYNLPERNNEDSIEYSYSMDPVTYFGSVVRNAMFSCFTGGYVPSHLGGSGSTPIAAILHGNNLYETILLNMPDISAEDYEDFIPYWERDRHYIDITDMRKSYLNLICLPTGLYSFDDFDENGNVTAVKKQSIKYPNDGKPQTVAEFMAEHDPCVITKRDKKTDRIFAVQSSRQRRPWAELAAFDRERVYNNVDVRPFSLKILDKLMEEGIVQKDVFIPVTLYMLSIKGQSKTSSYSSVKFEGKVPCRFFSEEAQAIARDYLAFVDICRTYLWICSKSCIEEAMFYSVGNDARNNSISEDTCDLFMETIKNKFLGEYTRQFSDDGEACLLDVKEETIEIAKDIFDRIPVLRGNYLTQEKWKSIMVSSIRKKGGITIDKKQNR